MGRWAVLRLLRRLTSSSSHTPPPPQKPPSSTLLCSSHISSIPHFCPDPNTKRFNLFRPFSSIPSSSFSSLAQNFDNGFRDNTYYVDDVLLEEDDDDVPAKIPVKAFFLSTSINLRSMQVENSRNVVPPTSRTSSNYVTFRFGYIPSEKIVRKGTGVENNVICNRYMVVLQYGSAVLFNVEDHEVDFFLNVARRHASGLLP